MIINYKNKCFQWASSHYLAEEVADDFFDNETEVQFEILEENAWQPFEGYRGKDIYQYISQLADDIANKKFPMKEV